MTHLDEDGLPFPVVRLVDSPAWEGKIPVADWGYDDTLVTFDPEGSVMLSGFSGAHSYYLRPDGSVWFLEGSALFASVREMVATELALYSLLCEIPLRLRRGFFSTNPGRLEPDDETTIREFDHVLYGSPDAIGFKFLEIVRLLNPTTADSAADYWSTILNDIGIDPAFE